MLYLALTYLLFCTSTALACGIVIYKPTIEELETKSVNHLLVNNKLIGYFSIFLCFTAAAPLLIFILLNKSSVKIFKAELLKTFLS